MATAQGITREKEFLTEEEKLFRRNAWMIIDKLVELSPRHPSVLVDEVLHSIFFLGAINTPPITPKHIVNDDDMFNDLKDCYPRPFDLFSSQLPKRSPFSCVLDMIVFLTGQENEDEIMNQLRKFIQLLRSGQTKKGLVSSTICVSRNIAILNSHRYYGVSMSTSGRDPGKIIVAASCLSTWDSYVAGAVMTYYPNDPKREFDGTIRLPKKVSCQAFNISQGTEIPPCKSCKNLFGLTTNENQTWPYGNCAEVESLSNLFKKDGEVREQARPTSETYTDMNVQKAKERVRKELNRLLRMQKFRWDGTFYTPQGD